MADDKKPKIDLKSRLQKMGGTPAPPPAAPSGAGQVGGVGPVGMPLAPPLPPPSVPAPPISRPSAAAMDPSNPLLAAAKGVHPSLPAAVASAPSMVAAQPQRIEVDEVAVHQARSGARKQGVIIGLVIAAAVGFISYMAGGAVQQGARRSQGVHDAHEVATALTKAKESLRQIGDATTAGGKSLIGERKFPADLAQKLSGMNVDFGGDKLVFVSFSGWPQDTTRDVFDFVTRVTALNARRELIVALLNKLQKPITAELSRPAGQLPISMVVVVDKDTPGGATRIASLVTPIAPDAKDIPAKLIFGNPLGAGNVELPRLAGDKIPKDGAVIPVVPTSYDKVCPAATKGQIAQLVTSMNSLIDDINGQKGASGDEIAEPKPGLVEMAGRLADALNKVN